MGVANLRGNLSGVVDLGALVREGTVPLRSDQAYAQCRLVALNPVLEVNCALLVDRLVGLRNVDAFTSSATAPQEAPAYFGHGYTDTQGEFWQEINLQALSLHPPFLSISA
jgi:twitching motility protein PilI